MMDRLREWVFNLSPRERNLVYAAGGLLFVALVYGVLVLPVQTTHHRMAARVAQKQADLAWMQQRAPQAAAAAGIAQGASGESLVALVDRTAREAGLASALRDQNPTGNSGIHLRFESASFDALIAWLASLQQQHGVAVDSATIAASGPGLVNATISLSQGGAAR
jgi:type II secretory pathway component PulM